MAVITEAIRIETDSSLSFGNYEVAEKLKVNEFKHGGDLYDLRTHKEITRLQKNGSLLIESVPGATIHNFKMNEKTIKFDIEGYDDTQITLELEPSKEYKIVIDDVNVGKTSSKVSGKVSFSIPLDSALKQVKVEKI